MPLAVFTVVWWVWDYQIPVRWWQEAASTSQRWEDHELEPKSRLYLQKCSSKPARTLHRASLLPADTRLISSPVLWGTTCLLSETNISDFASHFFCFCAKVTPMALLPYWKKVFPPSTQITPDILQMCIPWSCWVSTSDFKRKSSRCVFRLFTVYTLFFSGGARDAHRDAHLDTLLWRLCLGERLLLQDEVVSCCWAFIVKHTSGEELFNFERHKLWDHSWQLKWVLYTIKMHC